jgi:hypothetical protein
MAELGPHLPPNRTAGFPASGFPVNGVSLRLTRKYHRNQVLRAWSGKAVRFPGPHIPQRGAAGAPKHRVCPHIPPTMHPFGHPIER